MRIKTRLRLHMRNYLKALAKIRIRMDITLNDTDQQKVNQDSLLQISRHHKTKTNL